MAGALTRRGFLRSSALLTGAAAGSTVVSLPGALANGHGAHGAKTAPSDLLYGPAPGVAKLNSNENPYGPSEKALAAMRAATAHGAYYVDGSVARLITMIAEYNGVPENYISLSSGSSGVLTYLAVAKSQTGKILGPDLFWDTTSLAAVNQGGELKRTPKTADLGIDLKALDAALTDDISMVQICNPNNPTGMQVDTQALTAFCKTASKRATILVDEAYNEFTTDPEASSMVPLIKAGYDVVVARTFSKIYGLAGMRVGYMIAAPETTEQVKRYSLGNYALNQAGVAAAVASYNDTAFLDYSKSRILEAREMIVDAVTANGLKAAPSAASFVFVDLGDLNAETFRQKMAEHKVMIRGIYRDYTQYSRVSTGFLADVQQYVDALPKVLSAMNA